MQNRQTELYSTPSWLLQTLLMITAASAVILFFARNTRLGREFAYILRLCLTPKSTVKVLLLITAMVTLLLTEVRLNVLSTFMSKGLYDSMQDLNASAFWMFAAMNADVVLIRAFNNVVNDFLD
ncbi:hypothetical protein AW44_00715 [Neisseria gonorrhoeae]|nr:hypothetical protein AW44_00715 [Neisseria gonorrhoeae]KLT03227.1 hypothetical protein M782_05475 [Neisseria gonorrhoeae MU_NG17]